MDQLGGSEWTQTLNSNFPQLRNIHEKKTSEPDAGYNCIAWAFKDDQKHWWPNLRRSYWPFDASQMNTMEAFVHWFVTDGWEETTSVEVEDGFEKVALYALGQEPTHAARLLESGVWTSKLGGNIDLSHDLNDLDGPMYGQVIRVYRKPT